MSKRHRSREGDRAIVRDALTAAQGHVGPDVAHLLDAVPDLMAEARRRRHAAASPNLASALAERARRAIPSLAAATAVVVVLAAAIVLLDRRPASAAAPSFDSLVLTGGESNGGDAEDILLDAVTRGDETDG